jgi:ankyrin repeat protein
VRAALGDDGEPAECVATLDAGSATPLWLACAAGATAVVRWVLLALRRDEAQQDKKLHNHHKLLQQHNHHKLLQHNHKQQRWETGSSQPHRYRHEGLGGSDGFLLDRMRPDDRGVTPLAAACSGGHTAIVEMLLATADIDELRRCVENATAATATAATATAATVTATAKAKTKVKATASPISPLVACARGGRGGPPGSQSARDNKDDANRVRICAMLDAAADLISRPLTTTPQAFAEACAAGRARVAVWMLRDGVDLEPLRWRDERGRTGVMRAAVRGHGHVLEAVSRITSFVAPPRTDGRAPATHRPRRRGAAPRVTWHSDLGDNNGNGDDDDDRPVSSDGLSDEDLSFSASSASNSSSLSPGSSPPRPPSRRSVSRKSTGPAAAVVMGLDVGGDADGLCALALALRAGHLALAAQMIAAWQASPERGGVREALGLAPCRAGGETVIDPLASVLHRGWGSPLLAAGVPEAISDTTTAGFPCSAPPDECAVCLADIEPCTVALRLPCSHRFHATCAAAWFASGRATCPVCRQGGRD